LEEQPRGHQRGEGEPQAGRGSRFIDTYRVVRDNDRIVPRGRRGGWYQCVYAALLERFDRRYSRLVAERKRNLLGGLTGTVIEIGAGTGANLPFVNPGARWVGVDPNPAVRPYVEEKAKRFGLRAHLIQGRAERLPFQSACADAVISTLVLCGVADQQPVLEEILRVLKPGGRFIFLEHVAAEPGTATRRRQRLVRPVWSLLADGCRPDRETWRAIESAGFARIEYERFRLPLPIAGPHIAGVAIKDELG
jgi:ubiquinone/menaquinone biosynthesis C-methylase UbiE